MRRSRQSLLAPEVVQTSAMDCGPAALKCVLEGHGIHVSYGRLRDACQTDVDGTSIDTMETVASQLGLDAEQIIIPADHMLLPEARALPAIVVVQLGNGVTHFVVAWRRHGRLVQLMDPAGGRRWSTVEALCAELYIHSMTVAAQSWREWAASTDFQDALRRRLIDVGLRRQEAARLIETAASDPSWRALAVLDAATRMIQAIVDSDGLTRGPEAASVLERITGLGEEADRLIPLAYWSVRSTEPDDTGAEQLSAAGAVLVRIKRPQRSAAARAERGALPTATVAAVLEEEPPRPGRELLRMLREDRALSIPIIVAGLAVTSIAVVIEALLFRGLFDIGRDLNVREQRLFAIGVLLAFTLLLTGIELPIASRLLAAGRRLEARFRVRFFEKVPRLGDRYFHSRLTSDLAERVHSLHVVRQLPPLTGRFIHITCELLATTVAIIWIDPGSALTAMLLAAAMIGLPLASHPVLADLEMRMRTHNGGMSRYYLDALLGLLPIRTHGAERPLRREHGQVMREWLQSGAHLLRASIAVEGVQTVVGFGLAAWLLTTHLRREADATSLLLLYWTLRMPVLGDEFALVIRQYPSIRNATLRVLEPLLTPASAAAPAAPAPAAGETIAAGVSIFMSGVSVQAAGHTVLHDVDLAIPSGAHVAIVGASGAGKSTLVGLLLGWHTASAGEVLVDGRPLDAAQLDTLRRVTAWVDPAVHLWNRSLLENLRYGNPVQMAPSVGFALAAADLQGLLETLPEGLQTALGEGGTLVSGGEGQRVRLGRALLRPAVRLVILDEPFRGLDCDKRAALMALVREHWREATIVSVSHDIADTQMFERVLVVDAGAIVEDGDPRELSRRQTRYRSLLDAERDVREQLWSSPIWRHVRIDHGQLVEDDGPLVEAAEGAPA